MISYHDTPATRKRKLEEAQEIMDRFAKADEAAANAIDSALTRRHIRETPDQFLRRIGYKKD